MLVNTVLQMLKVLFEYYSVSRKRGKVLLFQSGTIQLRTNIKKIHGVVISVMVNKTVRKLVMLEILTTTNLKCQFYGMTPNHSPESWISCTET